MWMKFDTFLRNPNQASIFSQKEKKKLRTNYTLFPLGLGEWLSSPNLKGKKYFPPLRFEKNDTHSLPLILVTEYSKFLTNSFYQSLTIISKNSIHIKKIKMKRAYYKTCCSSNVLLTLSQTLTSDNIIIKDKSKRT